LRRLLPVLVVLALTPRAEAGSVSVVVTGDEKLKLTLAKQLEAWLRGHGHALGEGLPEDAKTSLLNCMVIDDEGCARGIVDSRAKTDSVVFGEVRAPRTKASNATTLIIYWLVRGKEPVGMRRACEDCNEDLLKSTVDDVLKTVVGASELARGRLRLGSKPAGLTVMLDNENVGITPLEREVPAGPHSIVLMSRGRMVGQRRLTIERDVTAEITMTVTLPDDATVVVHGPSRVGPGVAMAIGGVAIATGAILYFKSDVNDGSKPEYWDLRPAGIGVAAGGAVLGAIGAYLWLRAGSADSAPIAAIDHRGGIVGWTRAF
jgi:hypothetical protein